MHAPELPPVLQSKLNVTGGSPVMLSVSQQRVMNPPTRIPIARIEEYRTHYVGSKASGGGFMAFVTANVGPLNFAVLSGDGWQNRKKIFSVIHHFDSNGKHVNSDIETHGTVADGPDVDDAAWATLERKLGEMGDVTYSDIAIEGFRVEHDDCTFGLLTTEECGMFDEKEDHESMRYRVHLLPNDLLFYPPWTGEYDT